MVCDALCADWMCTSILSKLTTIYCRHFLTLFIYFSDIYSSSDLVCDLDLVHDGPKRFFYLCLRKSYVVYDHTKGVSNLVTDVGLASIFFLEQYSFPHPTNVG
jgi:hypothetical protein